MEGKKEKSVYFPGLNGLRALAALSVLWGHTFQDTFGKWYSKDGHLLQHSGGLFADGVTLFFVISGFLITYLLLKEVEKTDTVNIPKFYMRRILRIWPIYYGYIAVTILVLWWLGEQEQIISNTLWYYIFFAANVPFCSASGLWPIVHYWSIGVEEQFYLFWPWLVRIGKKYILPLASAVLVVWLLCKWGSFLVFGKTFIYRFFGVTRFHCMMLGAIGAVLLYKQNAYFLKIFGNRWITTIAWILFLTSGFYVNYIPAPCRAEFIATISLLLIISQLPPLLSIWKIRRAILWEKFRMAFTSFIRYSFICYREVIVLCK